MMKSCRKTMWFMVMAAALLPVGCASQRGRMSSKHEINTAQLLAAARQYEKEGQADSAAHIYQHVLKYHPTNAEARSGLALVQQGKLRVEYDTEQLLASNNPQIRKNPQARIQLAKQRTAQREQVNERMAQLIAQAARNPKKIEVDSSPTPAMIASATVESKPAPKVVKAVEAKPLPTATVAQAEAVVPKQTEPSIERTAFDKTDAPVAAEATPKDWAESGWTAHSLTARCEDANAAVLAEVKKLESTADAVRKDGLARLAHMGPEAKSAAPAIRELLRDQNQFVAAHAAWALWEADEDSFAAVNALQELLDSSSNDVIQFAAYTLGNMGEEAREASPKLYSLLKHEDSSTRLHAAEALMLTAQADQQAAGIDSLLVLLKDEAAEIRSLAAMALSQSPDTELAVAALTSALDDEDANVRSAAALALGAFGERAESAAATLQRKAETDQTAVRESAQTALACIQL